MLDQTVTPEVPYRLISRLASEFHLSGSWLALELTGGSLDEAVIAMLLLRASLPAWQQDGRITAATVPLPVGSISAIARSVDRSPETVRRLTYKLKEQGLCEIGQRGLLLTPGSAVAKRCLRYLEGLHDCTLGMIEQMLAHGVLKGASAGATRKPLSAIQYEVLVAALDMSLLPFETFRLPGGDWTTMVLWNTLSTMTVRHITEDALLSRQFASKPTPDEQRRAFSLRHVARIAGISYATAWRHIQTLERGSLVQRQEDKWFVSAGDLKSARVAASVVRNADYFLRRLRVVAALGLTEDNIGNGFIAGRPIRRPI